MAQLSEDKEWQRAGSADTADAYRQFLAQHPSGKWAQEARIRIENFSLGGPPRRERQRQASRGAGRGRGGVLSSDASGGYNTVSDGIPRRGRDSFSTAPSSHARRLHNINTRAARRSCDSAYTRRHNSHRFFHLHATNTTCLAVPPRPPHRRTARSREANRCIAAMPTSGYGVQLGAFSSEGAATTEWQQLTTRFSTDLHGLSPHVVSANTPTGHLFRLQAQVVDEAHARALCDALKKHQQPCVAVLPH